MTEQEKFLEDLSPKKIVEYLDKYVIGQSEAKKAVAIALRNRWRRQKVSPEIRDEILPKNILMIGPTGVGKTEIARRISSLINAPFIKVEATKYTEVGYVGRDVESIGRDLVEASYQLLKKKKRESVKDKARELAIERLADEMYYNNKNLFDEDKKLTKSEIKAKIKSGELNNLLVEINVTEKQLPSIGIAGIQGLEDIENQIKDLLQGFSSKKRRKLKVSEALLILEQEEAEKLIDQEDLSREAIWLAENFGIVFIDEIDKIASKHDSVGSGVSREGVQRDLLPILEGTTINTRYGPLKTDHVLFIGAGAFHIAKPSDLIPELQGRFPIRVELKSLNKEDFYRILKEPSNALTKQYKELLKTEGVDIDFTEEAIIEIAKVAEELNEKDENIGARRLHTIMEKILEDISFNAPELKGQHIIIDDKFVISKLSSVISSPELSKYIL